MAALFRRRTGRFSIVNFLSSDCRFHPAALAAAFLGATLLTGCAPTINLATPDPLKADIAVRLDVYEKASPTKAKDEQSSLEVAKNRRQRIGEIQQLKNDGVVGENRDGYLEIIRKPADPKYLAYAESVVDAETADRSFLYLANAQAQTTPLEKIEQEYAQLWTDRAFPGEWIQKENGNWIRK
jgi:uncharacterized protein YdbL (DUF1318 family)